MTSSEMASYRVYRPINSTVIPFERERRWRRRSGKGRGRRGRKEREGVTHMRAAGASEDDQCDWTILEPGSQHHMRLRPRKRTTGSLIGGRRCSISDVKNISSPVRE